MEDGGVEDLATEAEQVHPQLKTLTVVALIIGKLHQRDQLLQRVKELVPLRLRPRLHNFLQNLLQVTWDSKRKDVRLTRLMLSWQGMLF